MRLSSLFVFTGLVLTALLAIAPNALAVDIGDNPAGSNAVITVPSGTLGSPPAFEVTADFTYSSAAGAVFTDFTNTNTPGGIARGMLVQVIETFTNTGGTAWREANEGFFDIAVNNVGVLEPVFLFDESTIHVSLNGMLLAPGVHYDVDGSATSFPFQKVEIKFRIGSYVQPGDTLSIDKCFYKNSSATGDWAFGEVARASQSVVLVPEPAALGLLAVVATFGLRRRRA